MSAASAIEAKGIEFSYPKQDTLLHGVELKVDPGEMVGVIGPNGSGKTTLLNILAWSTKPDQGEVLVFGVPIGSMSARDRAKKVALVQQEHSVAFPFSVIEIVLMGRGPYLSRWELEGKSDVDTAREAMKMTGVDHLASRLFHELSGGEKQRVMVAKSLAQESPVLLLDEPTAFLDLKHQVEIYDLVKRLVRERGLAVLAVTHDVNLAAMFCDRVAVLAGGRIMAAGRPHEVLETTLLEAVYGVKVGLAHHPLRGEAPLVFPLGSIGQKNK